MQDGKADFHTHLKCTSYITPYMPNQVFLRRRVHRCMCLHIHVCVGMCVCLCVCRYVCSYVGWEKVQDLLELELQAIVGLPASQVGAGISALLLCRAASVFKCLLLSPTKLFCSCHTCNMNSLLLAQIASPQRRTTKEPDNDPPQEILPRTSPGCAIQQKPCQQEAYGIFLLFFFENYISLS